MAFLPTPYSLNCLTLVLVNYLERCLPRSPTDHIQIDQRVKWHNNVRAWNTKKEDYLQKYEKLSINLKKIALTPWNMLKNSRGWKNAATQKTAAKPTTNMETGELIAEKILKISKNSVNSGIYFQ